MSKVWDEYKYIKCGDFLQWWDNLNTKQKLEWQNKKDEIDVHLQSKIRQSSRRGYD